MRSPKVMPMPSVTARLSRATLKAREGCATPPQARRAAEEKNVRHANRAAKLAQIEERETGERVSKAVLDMGCTHVLEGEEVSRYVHPAGICPDAETHECTNLPDNRAGPHRTWMNDEHIHPGGRVIHTR